MNKICLLAVVGTALCCISGHVMAITRTWDGGGGNLLWSSANNWNPDGLPQAADDVVIDVPAAITVTYNTTAGINSLTCAETLAVTGGTLTLNAESFVDGTLTVSGTATLKGSGHIHVNGQLNWSSGSLLGGGTISIERGATFNITGTSLKTLSRTIENYGTANFNDNQSYVECSGAIINNHAGATFNQTPPIFEAVFSIGPGTNEITNYGVWNCKGAGMQGVKFNNAAGGVVNVLNNTTDFVWDGNFTGGGVHGGQFVPAPDATPRFIGAHVFNSDSSIAGPGNVRLVGGGTGMIVNGTIDLEGYCSCGNNITLNGSVNVSDFRFEDTGGWIGKVNGPCQASKLTILSAIVRFYGETTITDEIDFFQGGAENYASFDLSSVHLATLGSLKNIGTCTLNSDVLSAITSNSFSSLNNEGTLDVIGTGTLTVGGVPGVTLNNTGTLHLHGGQLLFNDTVTQYNTSNKSLTGGTWIVAPDATLGFAPSIVIAKLASGAHIKLQANAAMPAISTLDGILAGGSLKLTDGAIFTASPVAGTFSNQGLLHLEGSSEFNVNGQFTQTASGKLELGFSSLLDEPVHATGNIARNGTLTVQLNDGLQFALGDTAAAMRTTSGTITGNFATADIPDPEGVVYLRVVKLPAEVQLRAQIPGDVNIDDAVDIDDLLLVIQQWGACSTVCAGDIAPMPAGNSLINIDDLVSVIVNWTY